MTDLTYCHMHMTDAILSSKDLLEDTCDDLGELSDEELEIPHHMIPPNPDDCAVLPCHLHPSYPYGDPTNRRHPAALARAPNSRALFEDGTIYGMAPLNGWQELALDQLLPVDEQKAETERAAQARIATAGYAPPSHRSVSEDEEEEVAEAGTEPQNESE